MLNANFLSKGRFFKALLFFIIGTFFSGLSCGKRKPPQPPAERIVQRTQINGIQRGNVIELSWQLPLQNAEPGSVLNLNRADIYRLAETLNTPRQLSEEEFASRSTLISSIPITEKDFQNKEMKYADTLEFGGQNTRLRYAVRFVNASGQKAAFSNFLLIEPTAKVAGNPVSISGKLLEDSVELSWTAPAENIDGSKPVNIIGFNVYRADVENTLPQILNKNPITVTRFNDRSFNFGTEYKYFVRTVSLGNNSEPFESANSPIFEITPKDIFPPSAPGAITIAAAPNYLSIFFAFNQERDVVGYRIYRSDNRNRTLSEWTLITKDLLTTNTFQDKDIERGKTYYYYLTAVDVAGNTSERSEIVSETAP